MLKLIKHILSGTRSKTNFTEQALRIALLERNSKRAQVLLDDLVVEYQSSAEYLKEVRQLQLHYQISSTAAANLAKQLAAIRFKKGVTNVS